MERDIPQLGIHIPAVTLRRFWNMVTHYHGQTWNAAELDLLSFKKGRRIGIECKRMDAPTLTPSMRTALTDLKLDELKVVYPGTLRYALGKRVEVLPLDELVSPDVV